MRDIRRRYALIRRKREKRTSAKRKHGKGKTLLSLGAPRQPWRTRQQVIDRGKLKFTVLREDQTLRIEIPPVLSFHDDPNGALEFFDIFRSQFAKKFIRKIHLDHSECSQLGLGAQAMVDALVHEELQRRGKHGIIVGGTYPRDLGTKVMLKAIGTLRALGHPEMGLPADIEKRIERCDRLYGNGKQLKQDAARDRAGTNIVDYFNRVLSHQGFEMTPEGRSALAVLVTEVIGNAEEHAGRWYAIGYSFPGRKQGKDAVLECCQIAIFNFGRTIAESLSANSAAAEVKARIEGLVEHHARMKFFNDLWDEECVWTLSALQHGVTRYRKGTRGQSRGKGTIEMIKAFSELATRPQQMAVISGRAFIMFDGSYELQKNDMGLQQIAFNAQNDLFRPPDSKYVYRLKRHFPGTIISLRFMLDADHLQTRVVK